MERVASRLFGTRSKNADACTKESLLYFYYNVCIYIYVRAKSARARAAAVMYNIPFFFRSTLPIHHARDREINRDLIGRRAEIVCGPEADGKLA